jgi:hypothetical protein
MGAFWVHHVTKRRVIVPRNAAPRRCGLGSIQNVDRPLGRVVRRFTQLRIGNVGRGVKASVQYRSIREIRAGTRHAHLYPRVNRERIPGALQFVVKSR